MEPPGWMIDAIPNFLARRIESGLGKNPSEASTAPLARGPAFSSAVRQESTREGWPMPSPTVFPLLATTIALDFTKRQTLNANKRSAIVDFLGFIFVTQRKSPAVITLTSRS